MKFDFMRILHNMKDIGTEYVTYWYQFLTCCAIFTDEIFNTDSEIYCGSIKPFVPRFQKMILIMQSRSTLVLLQI